MGSSAVCDYDAVHGNLPGASDISDERKNLVLGSILHHRLRRPAVHLQLLPLRIIDGVDVHHFRDPAATAKRHHARRGQHYVNDHLEPVAGVDESPFVVVFDASGLDLRGERQLAGHRRGTGTHGAGALL